MQIKATPFLLIPESIELLTVRTMPSDAVAGEVFDIYVHAGLADGKSAPAGPAKRGDLMATMAHSVARAAAALLHAFGFFDTIAH